MRKPDEIALYAALRNRGNGDDRPLADEVGARLGIHHRRVLALLEKWTSNGWWNYGVSARTGWFESEAPEELKP